MISLDSRKYSEEELLDNLVVDREGYICGRIAGLIVEPDQIKVNLYGYETKKVDIPDEEQLVQRLLELFPKKGLFRRKSGTEEVYVWVRDALDLTSREPVTMDHLIKYAKTKNLEIPHKTQETSVRVEKGSIDWSIIDKIAFTELGKCVLLKEAVEAKNRGIVLSDEVAYKSTEYLVGRIIIDSEGKIVGSAVKFMAGNPPGILVRVERLIKHERIDHEALKKAVIPSMFKNLESLFRQVKKDLGVKSATEDALLVWIKKNNINVIFDFTEQKEVIMELAIDWSKIAKIGEVVILKVPIEKLSEINQTEDILDNENIISNNLEDIRPLLIR